MSVAARARRAYWPVRYAMWSPRRRPVRDGYAVLVPVPADLPMLLDISLGVIGQQRADGRVETVVIPDRRSATAARLVEKHGRTWSGGDLRLVDLRAPEQALLPRLRDPGKNHAAQLLRGIAAVDAAHVVLHDADLVPLDAGLHGRLWAAASAPGRHVAGVDPPWDPWFAERDRHLVATWEMCADVDWLRAFRPWRHFGHEAAVPDGRHVFDTTFWAQWRTEQRSLGLIDAADDFVHFNYVISTYRHFQRASGPFHDRAFRLLLLRVLVDLYGGAGEHGAVPSADQLRDGLRGTGPVRYEIEDAPEYLRMRARLLRLVEHTGAGTDLGAVLADFDRWAERTGEG